MSTTWKVSVDGIDGLPAKQYAPPGVRFESCAFLNGTTTLSSTISPASTQGEGAVENQCASAGNTPVAQHRKAGSSRKGDVHVEAQVSYATRNCADCFSVDRSVVDRVIDMNSNTQTVTANDWRHKTITRALRMAPVAHNGVEEFVLSSIHSNRPGCATLTAYAEQRAIYAFTEKYCTDIRRLIVDSALASTHDDETAQFFDWRLLHWRGVEIEMVLSPSSGTHADVIWIAENSDILHEVASKFREESVKPVGRALRFNSSWVCATDIDSELGTVTWDDVVLPPSTVTAIRSAIDGFFDNRGAYETLGFPWKRGILLIGPPGTGKTTVCKAVAASRPELPLLYVEEIDNGHEIPQVFRRARQLAPCILVFEDLDGFVNTRNRGQFLNEIDGFRSNEGILIIGSSNHPERIDEALLKRPSRFDQVFHVGLPAHPERKAYCLRILTKSQFTARLADSLDIDDLADRIADRTDGFTPAYLKEVFISAALLCAQEGLILLDEEFAVAALEQTEVLCKHLQRVKDPAALAEMSTNGNAMGLRR